MVFRSKFLFLDQNFFQEEHLRFSNYFLPTQNLGSNCPTGSLRPQRHWCFLYLGGLDYSAGLTAHA